MPLRPALLLLPFSLATPSALAEGADPSDVETVLVEAQRPPHSGRADEGYRDQRTRIGPLGERSALETPFAVQSISMELIRNAGANTFSEAAKQLPSVYTEGHFGQEFGPPVIRGFQGDDNAQSVRIDGLNVRADTALPLELYESLEVLYGPAASLYGPSPAAGMIDARLKRPTDTPLHELELGYTSGNNQRLRGDFAGRLGEAKSLGYHFSVLQADGESWVEDSKLHRALGGFALDYRLTDATLVELLGSQYSFDQLGYPGAFAYSLKSGLPEAPDPTRRGYGQAFGGVLATTGLIEAGVHHAFSNGWKLSANMLNQDAKREFHNTITNTLTDGNCGYTTSYRQSGSEAKVTSNALTLSGKFTALGLGHELTLGTIGYVADAYSVPGLRSGAALVLGSATLATPVLYADPGWGGTGLRYKSSHTRIQSLLINDTLSLSERWALLLAANDSGISTVNYSAAGAVTSRYDEHEAWSGSASLEWKFRGEALAYASFASSIQPGGTAPSTAANANEALSPWRSKHGEIGVKMKRDTIDWTAALFETQRPYAYTDSADNRYKSAGEQRNTGIELSARGTLGERLNLLASLTGLDPKMTETPSASTAGRLVVGVPRIQANLFAEYALGAPAGLIVEGNLHHVGRRAANAENTLWAGGYTTLDLGLRQSLRIGGKNLNARLMVSNVGNSHYWESLYTGGGWSGTGGNASGTAFVGAPRSFSASLSADF